MKPRLEDVGAARALGHRLAEADVAAGQLFSLSLLEEVLSDLLDRAAGDELLDRLLDELEKVAGSATLDRLLSSFAREYLWDGDGEASTGLAGAGLARPHRQGRLKQLLLFALLRHGLPDRPDVALLQESPLLEDPVFRRVTAALPGLLATEPGLAGRSAGAAGSLLDQLLPDGTAETAPAAWLERLVERRDAALGVEPAEIRTALDVVAEEEAPRFPPGPGPAELPSFGAEDEAEEEHYSVDRSWMARLVVVAKNVFVWLEQLSRDYGRPITKLDEIPSDELATLARRGFNGLWLIGLWQRSAASRRIKQLCGNREAEASAYSLASYRVAKELGGDAALARLERKAARHGIRLAADMVPNHMGLDSDWVLEHPERFLGLDKPPFPSYTFSGPDLSPDPAVGVYLEDHYYNRSDAAVVFQRIDRRRGRVRYLYHGNDGTSFPWNDTAQLNYLRADVREAVIETILAVARRFPVIRFDAAMTLARKHYRRLWFPEPGDAGAIPSRAGHGLSAAEFREAMPQEFWREVVDRVSAECPDTLLLAEAFWLMESYFVRTLGMHRVYNSAFMNMLRDGETEKFRGLLKETLAFDPEILKRYVNFMSNPDERTAVDQFGRGDRYFGVCTAMATLPGLPMFAHGQVEGFTERYGMEFRRARWHEPADHDLVARHERQIAPLLHRRELFAEVGNFRLYDLVLPGGKVDEETLAYSNGAGGERALVLFRNAPGRARGYLARSAPFAVRVGGAGEKRLTRTDVASALGVRPSRGRFLRFRDLLAGREYLQSSERIARRGLEVELGGYECRVLTGFATVRDDERGSLARLASRLGPRGVPDLDEALHLLALESLPPLLDKAFPRPLRRRLTPERLRDPATLGDDALLAELLAAAQSFAAAAGSRADVERARPRMLAAMTLPVAASRLAASTDRSAASAGRQLGRLLEARAELPAALALASALEAAVDLGDPLRRQGADLAAPRRLEPGLVELLAGAGEPPARITGLLCGLALGWGSESVEPPAEPAELLDHLLLTLPSRRFLGLHEAEGFIWLRREPFEELTSARLILEAFARTSLPPSKPREVRDSLSAWAELVETLRGRAEEAGYRVDRLRDLLRAAG